MQAVCRAVRSLDSFLEWPFFSRVLEQQKNNLTEYKGLHIGFSAVLVESNSFLFTRRGEPHPPSHHQPGFVFLHLLLRKVYDLYSGVGT